MSRKLKKTGHHTSETAALTFEDLTVPASCLLGGVEVAEQPDERGIDAARFGAIDRIESRRDELRGNGRRHGYACARPRFASRAASARVRSS